MKLCRKNLHDLDTVGRYPNGSCKGCQRLYRIEHRNEKHTYMQAHNTTKVGLIQIYNQEYHKVNAAAIREYMMSYRKAHPEKMRDANHRRRVRLLAGTFEYFDSIVIFSRDKWTCQLCYQPVDQHLKWPEPQSASIHHVVPISKGGSHTLENVVLAHLLCNLRQGVHRTSTMLEVASSFLL